MNKLKAKVKQSFADYKEYKYSLLQNQLRAMIILTGIFTLYAVITPLFIRLFMDGFNLDKVRVEFSILAISCGVPCVGFIFAYLSNNISIQTKSTVYEFLMLLVFFSAIVVYPNLGLQNAKAAGEYADYTIYFIISLIIQILFLMHPIHYLFAYGISTVLMIRSVMSLELESAKQIYNLVIFCIATTVLYIIKYYTRLHSFQKGRQIDEMQKNREQFLVSLTHEMRTPLNAVLGKNQMIMADTREEETRKLAKQVNSSGRMLLSLINDILDQSKLESGKMTVVTSDYQPYVMIADLGSIMRTVAEENGLTYIEEISPDIPPSICGDEVRIKQIILNLLSNAIKYTNTGSVTLKVSFDKKSSDTGFLNVAVTDTGIGIKEENISKLTEAFVRVDEEKNKYIQGTGLGLSITTSLLSMMGAKLNIESTYGEGSTFSFSVEQKISESASSKNSSTDSEAKAFPDAKILIVDDNRVNNSVIRGLLKKNSIVSDYASSGKECIEKVTSERYDIIFLDHMMPEMDGIETLSKLKSDLPGQVEKTVIIALTANYDSNAQTTYESLGFDGYLAKPVDVDKLNIILNKYLKS